MGVKNKSKQQLLKELETLKRKIRDSEEKYRNLVDNALVGIYKTNLKGDILYVNKALSDMFEFDSPQEMMKESVWRRYKNRKDRESLIKNLKRKGKLSNLEIEAITKTGKSKNILLNATLNKDFITGMIMDTTELKQAEKKLEILNRELLKSNKRLKQLVLRDPHTGLYNYRYLEEVIEAEFQRAKRYAHPLSLIMLDIDYFKSINDVYGHRFGDLVLKQLARLLKRMVRRYDVVIRIGGEEFVIISPGVGRAIALVLAQRISESINLFNFGNEKHTVKLKLSGAVVSFPEDRIFKSTDLIEVADKILSKAKEEGGNRIFSSIDYGKKKFLLYEESKESADVKFLKDKIEKLTKKANQSLVEAVFAFARTIKLKDHYTGEHVERTVHYATQIARILELSEDEIELVRQASILHDLGKIGISEKILLKKSKLTKKEFEEIKKHPQIGVDIIRPIQSLHCIIPFVLYHHERWDGTGYPLGLKGEEIPVGARIVAIADVYQALTSNRPYRKAYSKTEAMGIIKKGFGTQFSPEIAHIFLGILHAEK
jgi:diguanylate cyclase (GGDEF)-like protein/PAS domain S-box-containing protein